METVIMRAKHFKDAIFQEPRYCSLANAAREHFGTDEVHESVYWLNVGQTRYKHKEYTYSKHDIDSIKAKVARIFGFNDAVIRRVPLQTVKYF